MHSVSLFNDARMYYTKLITAFKVQVRSQFLLSFNFLASSPVAIGCLSLVPPILCVVFSLRHMVLLNGIISREPGKKQVMIVMPKLVGKNVTGNRLFSTTKSYYFCTGSQ